MSTKVTVLPGIDGIKQVYERTLAEKEVDFICTSTDYDQVLGGWYESEYSPRLEKSGVKVREILSGEGERCIASKAEGDVVIGQTWVGLVSYGRKSPLAVMIEDEEMVRGFRDRFEVMWECG